MMRRTMRFACCACAAVLASAGWAVGQPTGTEFTYQGALKESGAPANGSYDMDFSLWDALSGGSQVGSTVTFNSQAVTDGLFTVQLDFGANALDNSDRWIEITVNSTTLLPRQPITRAPYSIQTRGITVNETEHVGMGVSPGAARLRAWNFSGNAIDAVASGRAVEAISTSGDMAILASNQSDSGMGLFAQHQPSQNQGWIGTPDYGVYGRANDLANDWAGYFLGRAYVSDTLFVGRTNRIGSEYFGVHAPVASGYGGMYISTTGQSGLPFYGYAAGGGADMWHYYDGDTDKWHLYNGGVRLTVTGEGNVGIGTQSPSSPLEVQTSGNVAISGESTSSNGNGVFGFASSFTGPTFGVYGRSQSSDGWGVLGWAVSSTGNNVGVYGVSNSGAGWDFYAGGSGQDYGSSSSIRWKSNVRNIDRPLEKVARLRGVYFDWDTDHGGHHDVGMIAEEVGEVLPEIVNYEENGVDAIGLDYSKMTPLLVEALNALRAEKDADLSKLRAEKDAEITSLRAENAALHTRMDHLEQLVAWMAQKESETTK